MQKKQSDKLTDIVIGEAVASLASERTVLDCESLADRVNSMLTVETQPERQNALRIALTEARSGFPSARERSESDKQKPDTSAASETDSSQP